MPVKSPRINVVLEKPLFHTIKLLAERDGVSLSLKVRDPPCERGLRERKKICPLTILLK